MSHRSRETFVSFFGSYIGLAKDIDTLIKDLEAGVNRYGGERLHANVAGATFVILNAKFSDSNTALQFQKEFKAKYPHSRLEFDIYKLDLTLFKEGDRWGYKNRETGQVAIPPQFIYAESFIEERAIVEIDSKFGYIDETGQVVIPPQFDSASPFSEGIAAVKIGSKFGYIDKTGRVLVPPQLDWADRFSQGVAAVKIGSKFGYVDKTGKVVI